MKKVVEVLTAFAGGFLYTIGLLLGIMWLITGVMLSVDLFGWSLQMFMKLIGA